MRILFFTDGFTQGGKERMLLELMKGLRKRPEMDFELVIMSNEIHYKEVYDLGIRIHQVVRKMKKDLSVFKKIFTICKNYKPDVVHCWDSMTAVYLVPVLKLLNIRFMNCMVQDAPSKTGFSNKHWIRGQVTFPFSDVIVGNCKAGLAAYKVPITKGVCIPNGFDFKRVETLIPEAKIRAEIGIKTEFVVGMVATFSVFKDYETYFTAAQMLLKRRKDITFIAIGRDTDSVEAKSFIEKKYLEHFKLLGAKTDVESFVNILDIGVLATFTEGISNSIMEYMALGKPVIATSGGGTNEILEDTITGFLVSPKNPFDLAEKIELLLNDDELRMRMGKAGELRVRNNFTLDKMVNEFVRNYKKLASSS
jgi:glycosyltransferase involved in cell wall biosynthesis